MRSSYLVVTLLLGAHGFGQTELYFNDLEGPSSGFTLNTLDQGSTSAGANTWLVNDIYAGGDGLAECLGFELPFTIPSTAGQPVGIGSPNGNYLHTASTSAVASGILNCSFGAADGFCTDPGNHFARMSADISTMGQSDVTLSFWWLCQGGTANYGEVYYSTDGGVVWSLITTPITQYRSQSVWTQQNVTLAAFAEQNSLRFGFRFVNGTSLFGAADPGFGVDAIRVTAGEEVPAMITTGALGTNAFCEGATFSLPYSVVGVFTAGNVFTAQMSDAIGSFSAPTVIGSVVSTEGGSIACTFPIGIAMGSAYRVRVVGSAPVLIGSTNTSDISVAVPSMAGVDAQLSYCSGDAPVQIFSLLGNTANACGTWVGPDNVPMSGVFVPGSNISGVYTYTTNCALPCPADVAMVTVMENGSSNAGLDVEASVCANAPAFSPYNYINGGTTNGQFHYQGQPFPLPNFTVPGMYLLNYVVQGSGACGNDTALFVFTVLAPPNAGASLSYTLCVNASPVELVTLLVGAEAGGTWTGPSGNAFNGTLVPSTDISGLYTYTVSGDAPCPEAQAFVALVIDPCSGIGERTGSSDHLQWLGAQGNVHSFRSFFPFLVRNVELFDARGGVVLTRRIEVQGDRIEVDLAGVSSGMYTARFSALEGSAVVKLVQP